MSRRTLNLLVAAVASRVALGDLLGPVYPPPLDLSSANSTIPPAWESVVSVFDRYLDGSLDESVATSFVGLENVTFSIGAFSLDDPAAFDNLQYHYTSPEVKAGNGTDEVDADSIYVIASITKVFTALAGLINLDQAQWDTPLAECIPGLAGNTSTVGDPTIETLWSSITPWDLANQEGGVQEQSPQSDRYVQAIIAGLDAELPTYGLPKVSEFLSKTPCFENCTATQYAESVSWVHANVLSWTSPLYSNNGFVLLGLAIANLTGRPVSEVFESTIFEPLGMSSTSAGPPTNASDLTRSAVARDIIFQSYLPVYASSGGIYSTLRDLTAFGTAILNSTLLSPKQTRKWLNPSSHTANLNYSVGAPWEIIRFTSPQTRKVIDLYTKSGQSGDTDSHFVLVPDYNFGFTYLSVASNATIRAGLTGPILDLVAAALLPAIEEQAATEAIANFAGIYSSSDPSLNSSVVISFNDTTATGVGATLSISQWISNGSDILTVVLGEKPRLLLTIPDQGNGRVAFQASTYGSTPAGPFTGTLATNGDWFTLDAVRWGGFGQGLFVFDVDGEGRATAVLPGITQTTLQRTRE